MEFAAGLVIGGAIAFIVSHWLSDKKFRLILQAIYKGHAKPDENGNVGWTIQ